MKLRKAEGHHESRACRRLGIPDDVVQTEVVKPGRVLVVDTDLASRGLICSSLRHLGYNVTEADDPHSAMMLASRGERFDLVVTEVQLRPTGGVAMARKLLDDGATSAILFMTESAAVARVLSRSVGTGMLMVKPFSADDFRRRIEDALHRPTNRQNIWTRQRLRAIGGRSDRSLWRSLSRRNEKSARGSDDGGPEMVN
jgi:DNA-binding response OmpR family regulator